MNAELKRHDLLRLGASIVVRGQDPELSYDPDKHYCLYAKLAATSTNPKTWFKKSGASSSFTLAHEPLTLRFPLPVSWISDCWKDVLVAGGSIHNSLVADHPSFVRSDIDIFVKSKKEHIDDIKNPATYQAMLERNFAVTKKLLHNIREWASLIGCHIYYWYHDKSGVVNVIVTDDDDAVRKGDHDELKIGKDSDSGRYASSPLCHIDPARSKTPLYNDNIACTSACRHLGSHRKRKFQIITNSFCYDAYSLLNRFDLAACQFAYDGSKVIASLAAKEYLSSGIIFYDSKSESTVPLKRRIEHYSRPYIAFVDISNYEEWGCDRYHFVVNGCNTLVNYGLDTSNRILDSPLVQPIQKSSFDFMDCTKIALPFSVQWVDGDVVFTVFPTQFQEDGTPVGAFKHEAFVDIFMSQYFDVQSHMSKREELLKRLFQSIVQHVCIHQCRFEEFGDPTSCQCGIYPQTLLDIQSFATDNIYFREAQNKRAADLYEFERPVTEFYKKDNHPEFLSTEVLSSTSAGAGEDAILPACQPSLALNADTLDTFPITLDWWNIKRHPTSTGYIDGPIESATCGWFIGDWSFCPHPKYVHCVFFTDTLNDAIRCINLVTRYVTTFCGGNGLGPDKDDKYSRSMHCGSSDNCKLIRPFKLTWIDTSTFVDNNNGEDDEYDTNGKKVGDGKLYATTAGHYLTGLFMVKYDTSQNCAIFMNGLLTMCKHAPCDCKSFPLTMVYAKTDFVDGMVCKFKCNQWRGHIDDQISVGVSYEPLVLNARGDASPTSVPLPQVTVRPICCISKRLWDQGMYVSRNVPRKISPLGLGTNVMRTENSGLVICFDPHLFYHGKELEDYDHLFGYDVAGSNENRNNSSFWLRRAVQGSKIMTSLATQGFTPRQYKDDLFKTYCNFRHRLVGAMSKMTSVLENSRVVERLSTHHHDEALGQIVESFPTLRWNTLTCTGVLDTVIRSKHQLFDFDIDMSRQCNWRMLSFRFAYFKNVFSFQGDESKSFIIEFNDPELVPVKLLRLLLEAIYTGEVPTWERIGVTDEEEKAHKTFSKYLNVEWSLLAIRSPSIVF